METVIINGVERVRDEVGHEVLKSVDFDDVSPTPEVVGKVQSIQKDEKKEKAEKIPKERINGLVPKVLYDKLKNIVLWYPDSLTMTDLLTKGLELVVAEFPDLPVHGGKLKVGRRPKKVENTNETTTTSKSTGTVPKSRAEILEALKANTESANVGV